MGVPAISMIEPKNKLENLRVYLPDGASRVTYEFGAFLAEYIGSPELLPMGFVMGCHLAIYDLQQGVSGFTGQPIRGAIAGYPKMMYALLDMEIPKIADAIFPAEFAAEVRAFIDQVKRDMANARS